MSGGTGARSFLPHGSPIGMMGGIVALARQCPARGRQQAEVTRVLVDSADFRCVRLVDLPSPYWDAVFEALPDASHHG